GIRDRNVTGVQTCALPISAKGAMASAVVQKISTGWWTKRSATIEMGTKISSQFSEGRRKPGTERPLYPRRMAREYTTIVLHIERSEERRVGKEWRSGGARE